MLYSLLRPIIFQLEAEQAHHITLRLLRFISNKNLIHLIKPISTFVLPQTVMGVTFSNPVGLAAGLDKNGDFIDALGQLGFGFLEVGTVTPRPQPGNPKPRLFRLPDAQAIINRMGFNNNGVDYLVARLKKASYKGVIGVNIGKNFDTPLANAPLDYIICMRKVYPYASYIAINISSPNTKGLRNLQEGDDLEILIKLLKEQQQQLTDNYQRTVPLVVKIAPDLDDDQLTVLADVFNHYQVEGVIATNTTIERNQVTHMLHGNEQGGLSGAPLTTKSTYILQQLRKKLNPNIPLIGVGGIMTPADAQAKLYAGADLVQLYTGFVYNGPDFVNQVMREITQTQHSH